MSELIPQTVYISPEEKAALLKEENRRKLESISSPSNKKWSISGYIRSAMLHFLKKDGLLKP